MPRIIIVIITRTYWAVLNEPSKHNDDLLAVVVADVVDVVDVVAIERNNFKLSGHFLLN